MDSVDFENAMATFLVTMRHTLRVELTSVWLPIQLVAILVACLVAWASAVAVRRRWFRQRWAGRPICASSSAP
jgi:hypothetical protein